MKEKICVIKNFKMNQRDEFKYKKLDAQKAQPLLIKWIILILVCLFSTGFIGFLVWKLFYIIRNQLVRSAIGIGYGIKYLATNK